MTLSTPGIGPRVAAQSGITLIITLIVLVAMTLASVAMVRSVDTSVMIAGNLAFRQGATTAGDAGVEAARAWLVANSGALANDDEGNGYYSSSQDNLDLTGNRTPGNTADDVDWEDTGIGVSQPVCLAPDTAGNTACYIIHRLCIDPNSPLDSAKCSTQESARSGSSKGASLSMERYQPTSWSMVATMAYYRVTVRVAGPRNNISFIQTFLLI